MVSYHQKNSTWALILKINTFFIKCVEYKHRTIFNIKEKINWEWNINVKR